MRDKWVDKSQRVTFNFLVLELDIIGNIHDLYQSSINLVWIFECLNLYFKVLFCLLIDNSVNFMIDGLFISNYDFVKAPGISELRTT